LRDALKRLGGGGDRLGRAKRRMLRRDIKGRGVRDPRVLQAMESVPREAFTGPEHARQAYADRPLPIGMGQTISQPYVVAWMAEALELRTTDRVLEVGTGSGYAAAVLSLLCDAVYSVERHGFLATGAGERLAALGYANVRVRHGDGAEGWPEQAPYDAIVVAAAAPRVPDSLLEQLCVGGRLVMPVGRAAARQNMVRMRRGAGGFSEEGLGVVRFVPLVYGKPDNM